MRKVPIFFALMLIGAAFASPAQADGQCEALSEAVFRGNSGKTKALIASGVSVNCSLMRNYREKGKTTDFATTPLHYAAGKGKLKAVQLLLSHGANASFKDGAGKMPLDYLSDYTFRLMFLDAPEEMFDEAEEISRLLKQAGGVYSR